MEGPDPQENPVRWLRRFASQGAMLSHKVRGALGSMVSLCAVTTIPAFVSAWWFRENSIAACTLIGIGSLPVIVTCVGFLVLLFRDPDKLQSEEYQIRRTALSIIVDRATDIPLDSSTLSEIATTALENFDHTKPLKGT